LARRLEVSFVCSTLAGGGAERFVSCVLSRLDRASFAPRLCLFRDQIVYPLPDDVAVHVLNKHRPWHIPIAIAKLARWIDATRPDVVFSAFGHPNFVTGNALRLARHRPRWVARVSAHPDRDEAGWLRGWMRPLYARCDLVLANSRGLADAYRALHPRAAARIEHLPNPVDFEQLDALASAGAPPAPSARPRLICMGRLVAVKRVDLQLAACARLRDRVDFELVVCGDGPLRRRLERQARALGLGDRVRFLGFLANPFAWLARSDLFLLSSDSEGLPNALIEAQGLGIPGVAGDCEFGPREILQDGVTGSIVPVGDAAALAQAIDRLLGDAPRRRAMGAAAREHARRNFAAGPIVTRLEQQLRAAAAPTGA
jgi:glycosyltransferase involved in cell wall biosynthesis